MGNFQEKFTRSTSNTSDEGLALLMPAIENIDTLKKVTKTGVLVRVDVSDCITQTLNEMISDLEEKKARSIQVQFSALGFQPHALQLLEKSVQQQEEKLQQQQQFHHTLLSDDAWSEVFKFLPAPQLLTIVNRVCKRWQNLVQRDDIWKSHCCATFTFTEAHRKAFMKDMVQGSTWKQVFEYYTRNLLVNGNAAGKAKDNVTGVLRFVFCAKKDVAVNVEALKGAAKEILEQTFGEMVSFEITHVNDKLNFSIFLDAPVFEAKKNRTFYEEKLPLDGTKLLCAIFDDTKSFGVLINLLGMFCDTYLSQPTEIIGFLNAKQIIAELGVTNVQSSAYKYDRDGGELHAPFLQLCNSLGDLQSASLVNQDNVFMVCFAQGKEYPIFEFWKQLLHIDANGFGDSDNEN